MLGRGNDASPCHGSAPCSPPFSMGYFIALSFDEGSQRYFVPTPLRQWSPGIPVSAPIRTGITFAPSVARALAAGLLFSASASRLPQPRSWSVRSQVLAYCSKGRLEALERAAARFLDVIQCLAEGLSESVLQQAPLKLGLLSPQLPRKERVWIGSGHSMGRSSWICPEARHYERLAGDLIDFFNDGTRHDASAMGKLHFQFTSLHPLKDGNGRMARALVSAYVLRATGSLVLSAAASYVMVRWRHSIAKHQLAARGGNPAPLFRLWPRLLEASEEIARVSRQNVLDLGSMGFELDDILPCMASPVVRIEHGQSTDELHPLLHRRCAKVEGGWLYESRPFATLFKDLHCRRKLEPRARASTSTRPVGHVETPTIEPDYPYWPCA